MRATRITGTGIAAEVRRTPRRAAADGTFAALINGTTVAEDDATVGPAAAVGIDGLVTVQAAGDEAAAAVRARALAYGGEVLDRLERLRLDLLAGAVPVASITALARAVRSQRTATADDHIEAVLDAIELRAGVELAKLERRR